MFETTNMSEFGLCLRALRNAMGYTLEEVAYAALINPETVRRIENGKVIPKYETLELISAFYKTDILAIFMRKRMSIKIHDFYNQLDEQILNFNYNELQSISNLLDRIVDTDEVCRLINQAEWRQFRLILKGIEQYNSVETQNQSLDTFISAMRITIKDFNVNEFEFSKYNTLEYRILILIAIAMCTMREYAISNKILEFCRELLQAQGVLNESINNMILKVEFNLSYNSHCLDKHDEAYQYANQGIHRCLDNDTNYLLAHFLIRKGVAMHFLGDVSCIEPIKNGLILLVITGKSELAKKLKYILVNRYEFCRKGLSDSCLFITL